VKSWLVIFVVVCVAAIVATHVLFAHEPEPLWIETRATQIHVGPWVAEIPAGWRDVHELRDPYPAVPISGSRMLLTEDPRNVGYGQILVFPLAPMTGDLCHDFAKLIAEQGKGHLSVGRADTATWGGDKGCIYSIAIDGHPGLLLTRTHGLSGVGVRCLGHDASLSGTACDSVIYGLRIGQ
jgi:hypothetical protein